MHFNHPNTRANTSTSVTSLWRRIALQMIYFMLAALALGFVRAEKSAVLELTGDAPTVHFGELGGTDTLTLVHNSSEDELVCSGKIRASDLVIDGTSTTVADLIQEVAAVRQDMAAVKAFVGMMPPAMPPAVPPPASPPPLGLQQSYIEIGSGTPAQSGFVTDNYSANDSIMMSALMTARKSAWD